MVQRNVREGIVTEKLKSALPSATLRRPKKSVERNSFMSGPEARAALFKFVHEHGEVSFSELRKFVAEKNLYLGGGVSALDVLRNSDGWYTVEVDDAHRKVFALVLVAATR